MCACHTKSGLRGASTKQAHADHMKIMERNWSLKGYSDNKSASCQGHTPLQLQPWVNVKKAINLISAIMVT